jgi:hypothetical protein
MQYKLIQNLSGTQELYDLSQGLNAQSNLLTGTTDYSAKVNALKAQGTGIRAAAGSAMDSTGK